MKGTHTKAERHARVLHKKIKEVARIRPKREVWVMVDEDNSLVAAIPDKLRLWER